MNYQCRVSPFGHLRIKACVPLPEAFRSLLRPSSPDDAKASINCCNWFMQTHNILGVYFTHLLKNIQTFCLNFQRTKWTYNLPLPSPPSNPTPRLSLKLKMVGPDGLEPSTPRLSSACSNQLSYEPKSGNKTDLMASFLGGADRVRTGDPLLAKQVLYQLSYDPIQGLKRCYKELILEIYFVRSTETQKLSRACAH